MTESDILTVLIGILLFIICMLLFCLIHNDIKRRNKIQKIVKLIKSTKSRRKAFRLLHILARYLRTYSELDKANALKWETYERFR